MPKLTITPGKIEALTRSLEALGFSYGLDFKIDPLSQQAPDVIGRNGQTGAPAKKGDCSGFVRWRSFHAAGVTIPDGSVSQRRRVSDKRFRQCQTALSGLALPRRN